MSAITERPGGEGCEVIAVQYREGFPGKTFYLTSIDVGRGSDFRGRRDDGKGVRIEDGVAKVRQSTRRFQLGTVAYLISRGVPASLAPTSVGFSFVAYDRIDVRIDAD